MSKKRKGKKDRASFHFRLDPFFPVVDCIPHAASIAATSACISSRESVRLNWSGFPAPPLCLPDGASVPSSAHLPIGCLRYPGNTLTSYSICSTVGWLSAACPDRVYIARWDAIPHRKLQEEGRSPKGKGQGQGGERKDKSGQRIEDRGQRRI